MLRGMLQDAIGITEVALTESSGRKEKVEPELPLFRLLREPGVWGSSHGRGPAHANVGGVAHAPSAGREHGAVACIASLLHPATA